MTVVSSMASFRSSDLGHRGATCRVLGLQQALSRNGNDANATRPVAAALRPLGAYSFNHLVGAYQQRRWHGEAESLGGLEIDDELELYVPERAGRRASCL
jgi:hypothetical protein